MATRRIENASASMAVRHRALCEEGDFKGSWRASMEDAFADANRHRAKPGNETHLMRIETEQKVSLRLND